MNTEFPSRLPTIQNSTTSSRSSTITVTKNEQISDFEKSLLTIFRSSVKTLNNISDFVSNLYQKVSRKDTKKSTKIQPSTEKVVEEVKSLRRDNKKTDQSEKAERSFFYKKITNGISYLTDTWKDSIRNLASTVESTNSSIGSAIGNVFGSGVIGRLVGNVVTKALNLATSKILMGMIVQNIPTILKLGVIGLAIAGLTKLVVKYWDKIVPVIQWIWDAIDQGFDWIKSFFGHSKYEDARKGLMEEFGVDEGVIKKYYGDTVKGRARMLEDWRKIEKDDSYADSIRPLIREIRDQRNSDINALFSSIKGMPQLGSSSTSIINNQTIINRDSDSDSLTSSELPYMSGTSSVPNISTINNVSTVTNAINGMTSNNVSTAYPMSPIPQQSQSWIGGYSPIQ